MTRYFLPALAIGYGIAAVLVVVEFVIQEVIR